MINLAGHPKADSIVHMELFVAGVPIFATDQPYGETRTRYEGRLIGAGGETYVFRRAWYYWVVDGPVPLEIAEKIYAQEPYGRDARVDGDCGAPPPNLHRATHRTDDGKTIHYLRSKGDRELLYAFREGKLEGAMADALGPLFRGETGPIVLTAEERDALTVSRTIDLYHIDSQAGLKVFCDAVRAPR